MQTTSRASYTTRGDTRRQVEGFSASGERNRDTIVDLSTFFAERGYSSNQAPSKHWEERPVTVGSIVVPKWVPVTEHSVSHKEAEGDELLIGYDAIYYPKQPPERQPITLGSEENDGKDKDQPTSEDH